MKETTQVLNSNSLEWFLLHFFQCFLNFKSLFKI